VKIDKLFGAIFALLSVIIGAFNSHAFKKILPYTALESIDVGLRYMMYHGLALLILSILSIEEKKWIAIFFIVGTIFFSFSIFLLSIQSRVNIELSWLGPITPIGGCFLIFGWILLVYKFVKQKKISN
jgi:uncharacterized membrane protein YgdD (TMEM256/DUF423 family)